VPQLRRPSVRFPKLPCERRNGSCEHCEVPARRPVCGALTAVMSLTEFSESLKVGEYYAVYAAEDEKHLEGPFWLARITEPMTTADEDYVYAGKSTSHCHVCLYASADAPSGI